MRNQAIQAFTFVVEQYLRNNPDSILHYGNLEFPYLGDGIYVATFSFRDYPYDLDFGYINEDYIEKCIELAQQGKKSPTFNLYKEIDRRAKGLEDTIRLALHKSLVETILSSKVFKDFSFIKDVIFDYSSCMGTQTYISFRGKDWLIRFDEHTLVALDGHTSYHVPFTDKQAVQHILSHIGADISRLVVR